MSDPRSTRERIVAMMEPHETLHSISHTGGTSQGDYYLVIREWPHPDLDDAKILSERIAYLTKDPANGSDGWTDNGINRRDVLDDGDLARELAQMYAKIAARQEADVTGDPIGSDLSGE